MKKFFSDLLSAPTCGSDITFANPLNKNSFQFQPVPESKPQSAKISRTVMPNDINLTMDEWMAGGFSKHLHKQS